MTLPARELLMEVSKLTELQNVRIALKETFKAGCLAGASAMIGGLTLGPPGIAIGGVIGSFTASYIARDKYKSVVEIIMYDLTLDQKEKLAEAVQKAVTSVELKDVAQFAIVIAQNPTIATTVATTVLSFLESEMRMKIVD